MRIVGVRVETSERSNGTLDSSARVKNRLISAPVYLPLGGSKTGFGECRSSEAKLDKFERLAPTEERQHLSVSSQCDTNNGDLRLKAGKNAIWCLILRFRKCTKWLQFS